MEKFVVSSKQSLSKTISSNGNPSKNNDENPRNKYSKLELQILKKFDEKSIPSPTDIVKSAILNVYSRNSVNDEFDNIEQFQNLYNHTNKNSIFDSALSRIESQDNMLGSGFALSDFMETNDNNQVFKVLPCFYDDRRISLTKKNCYGERKSIKSSESEIEPLINIYKGKQVFDAKRPEELGFQHNTAETVVSATLLDSLIIKEKKTEKTLKNNNKIAGSSHQRTKSVSGSDATPIKIIVDLTHLKKSIKNQKTDRILDQLESSQLKSEKVSPYIDNKTQKPVIELKQTKNYKKSIEITMKTEPSEKTTDQNKTIKKNFHHMKNQSNSGISGIRITTVPFKNLDKKTNNQNIDSKNKNFNKIRPRTESKSAKLQCFITNETEKKEDLRKKTSENKKKTKISEGMRGETIKTKSVVNKQEGLIKIQKIIRKLEGDFNELEEYMKGDPKAVDSFLREKKSFKIDIKKNK